MVGVTIFISAAQKKKKYPGIVNWTKDWAEQYLRNGICRRCAMMIVYPVLFTKTGDKKDTYLIEIPDINGMTEGYSLSDAIRMARDYIGCTLHDKDDSTFPAAGDIRKIDPSKGKFADSGETFVSLIDLDIDEFRKKMDTRAVRKNVSIPAWLDKEAAKVHINLSRTLQDALKEKLTIA